MWSSSKPASLPHVLLEHVCGFLDGASIARTLNCCQGWRINQPARDALWRRTHVRDFGHGIAAWEDPKASALERYVKRFTVEQQWELANECTIPVSRIDTASVVVNILLPQATGLLRSIVIGLSVPKANDRTATVIERVELASLEHGMQLGMENKDRHITKVLSIQPGRLLALAANTRLGTVDDSLDDSLDDSQPSLASTSIDDATNTSLHFDGKSTPLQLGRDRGRPTMLLLHGKTLIGAYLTSDTVTVWWDVARADEYTLLDGHDRGVMMMDANWDEQLVCVGCIGGLLRVWHLNLDSRRVDPIWTIDGDRLARPYSPIACLDVAAAHGPWPRRRRIVFARHDRLFASDLPEVSLEEGTSSSSTVAVEPTELVVCGFPRPRDDPVHRIAIASNRLVVGTAKSVLTIGLRELRHGHKARPRRLVRLDFPMVTWAVHDHGFVMSFASDRSLRAFHIVHPPPLASSYEFRRPNRESSLVKMPRQLPYPPTPIAGQRNYTTETADQLLRNHSNTDLAWRCELKLGDRLDARDEDLWYSARVLAAHVTDMTWVLVTYDDWIGDEYDEWFNVFSPKLAQWRTHSKPRLVYQYRDITTFWNHSVDWRMESQRVLTSSSPGRAIVVPIRGNPPLAPINSLFHAVGWLCGTCSMHVRNLETIKQMRLRAFAAMYDGTTWADVPFDGKYVETILQSAAEPTDTPNGQMGPVSGAKTATTRLRTTPKSDAMAIMSHALTCEVYGDDQHLEALAHFHQLEITVLDFATLRQTTFLPSQESSRKHESSGKPQGRIFLLRHDRRFHPLSLTWFDDDDGGDSRYQRVFCNEDQEAIRRMQRLVHELHASHVREHGKSECKAAFERAEHMPSLASCWMMVLDKAKADTPAKTDAETKVATPGAHQAHSARGAQDASVHKAHNAHKAPQTPKAQEEEHNLVGLLTCECPGPNATICLTGATWIPGALTWGYVAVGLIRMKIVTNTSTTMIVVNAPKAFRNKRYSIERGS